MGRFILESDGGSMGRVVPQNELVLAFDRMGAELATLVPHDDDPLNVEFDIPSEVSGNFIWHSEPTLDRSSGKLTVGQLMIDGILIDSDYTFYHDISGVGGSPWHSQSREFRAGISLEAEREDTDWSYDRLPDDPKDYATAFERERVTRFLWLTEKLLFPPEDSVFSSSRELVAEASGH